MRKSSTDDAHIVYMRIYSTRMCHLYNFHANYFSGRNSYFDFFFVRFWLQIDLRKISLFLARMINMCHICRCIFVATHRCSIFMHSIFLVKTTTLNFVAIDSIDLPRICLLRAGMIIIFVICVHIFNASGRCVMFLVIMFMLKITTLNFFLKLLRFNLILQKFNSSTLI